MSHHRLFLRGTVCLLGFAAVSLCRASTHDQGQVSNIVATALTAQGVDSKIDDTNIFSEQINLKSEPFASLLKDQTPPCAVKHQALILHLAHWTAANQTGPFQLTGTSWSVYHATNDSNDCVFKRATLRTNAQGEDEPLLYGDKSAFLIAINTFVDSSNAPSRVLVNITYKVSATPNTPENVQNLGMLVTALLGAKSPTGGGEEKPPVGFPMYVAVGKIKGYKRMPFTFNFGYTMSLPNNSGPTGTDLHTTGPPSPTAVQVGYVDTAYAACLPFSDGIGRKTFNITKSNQPPEGLKLDPSGILRGTPKNQGTAPFIVEVADSSNPPVKKSVNYVIMIAAKDTQSTVIQPNPTQVEATSVGANYSSCIPFQGGIGEKSFVLSAGSNLPAGLTLDSNGILHGAPSVSGNSAFVVTVTDSSSPSPLTSTVNYIITVEAAAANASVSASGGAAQKPDTTKQNNDDSSQKSSKSDQQAATVVDCTSVDQKTPCTFKQTFRSQDKEYWDVGLSVPIPGVKQTNYTLSNGTAKSSVTRHVDLYAFLDIYPLAHWFDKRGPAPHFDVGLPVTSQTFYRPFFGVAENFTNWTKLQHIGFPLEMSVFAGVVDMRVQYPVQSNSMGTTTTILQSTRIVKALFGVELSVSDLVSKIGGKSKK